MISFIATVCTSTSRGTLATLTGLNPSTWTLYSHAYVASRTTPTLTFAFLVDGTREYHLDEVSVISVTSPLTQLLTNPSFENSTSTPAGWTVGCESTCGGPAAHVLSGANCYLSSGLCFSAHCSSGRSAFILLSQSFNATIGNTYTITYQLIQTGSASAGLLQFYLDVL